MRGEINLDALRRIPYRVSPPRAAPISAPRIPVPLNKYQGDESGSSPPTHAPRELVMSRLHSIAFGLAALLSACAPDSTAPSAPPDATTPDLSLVSDGATIFIHVSVSVFVGEFAFPFTVTGGKKVGDCRL